MTTANRLHLNVTANTQQADRALSGLRQTVGGFNNVLGRAGLPLLAASTITGLFSGRLLDLASAAGASTAGIEQLRHTTESLIGRLSAPIITHLIDPAALDLSETFTQIELFLDNIARLTGNQGTQLDFGSFFANIQILRTVRDLLTGINERLDDIDNLSDVFSFDFLIGPNFQWDGADIAERIRTWVNGQIGTAVNTVVPATIPFRLAANFAWDVATPIVTRIRNWVEDNLGSTQASTQRAPLDFLFNVNFSWDGFTNWWTDSALPWIKRNAVVGVTKLARAVAFVISPTFGFVSAIGTLLTNWLKTNVPQTGQLPSFTRTVTVTLQAGFSWVGNVANAAKDWLTQQLRGISLGSVTKSVSILISSTVGWSTNPATAITNWVTNQLRGLSLSSVTKSVSVSISTVVGWLTNPNTSIRNWVANQLRGITISAVTKSVSVSISTVVGWLTNPATAITNWVSNQLRGITISAVSKSVSIRISTAISWAGNVFSIIRNWITNQLNGLSISAVGKSVSVRISTAISWASNVFSTIRNWVTNQLRGLSTISAAKSVIIRISSVISWSVSSIGATIRSWIRSQLRSLVLGTFSLTANIRVRPSVSSSGRGYARGTSNYPGGLGIVGEEGPELVRLPRGSQIYTAAQTRRMAGSPQSLGGRSGGGTTIIQPQVNFYGPVTNPEEILQAVRQAVNDVSFQRQQPWAEVV